MSRELRFRLVAAFAAVYVVWGSTYLGIRFAVETIPPFLMAGVRFVVAGAMMLAWGRARGSAWPTAREWRAGIVAGLLLLLGGNGGVCWAELRVPSAVAALLVAAVPLWMVTFDWLRPGGSRPRLPVIAGLLAGFGGVALLIAPTGHESGRVDLAGALALVVASISWALGSLYSRRAGAAPSPQMATGVNMLGGGVGLLVASIVAGEPARMALSAVSGRSLLALGYLVLFGSIVGFGSYMWLLRNTTPAKAATYAYVNPVIAVLLGWLLAGEPVTGRILGGAAVIVAGVVLITSGAQLGAALRRAATLVGLGRTAASS